MKLRSGSSDASMQSSELGSESSDHSESTDEDASGYMRGRVDMNLQYLQSFHAVASNKKSDIEVFSKWSFKNSGETCFGKPCVQLSMHYATPSAFTSLHGLLAAHQECARFSPLEHTAIQPWKWLETGLVHRRTALWPL